MSSAAQTFPVKYFPTSCVTICVIFKRYVCSSPQDGSIQQDMHDGRRSEECRQENDSISAARIPSSLLLLSQLLLLLHSYCFSSTNDP